MGGQRYPLGALVLEIAPSPACPWAGSRGSPAPRSPKRVGDGLSASASAASLSCSSTSCPSPCPRSLATPRRPTSSLPLLDELRSDGRTATARLTTRRSPPRERGTSMWLHLHVVRGQGSGHRLGMGESPASPPPASAAISSSRTLLVAGDVDVRAAGRPLRLPARAVSSWVNALEPQFVAEPPPTKLHGLRLYVDAQSSAATNFNRLLRRPWRQPARQGSSTTAPGFDDAAMRRS